MPSSLAASSLLSRLMLLAVSGGAAMWAATARYAVGLDFEGGAFVELEVNESADPETSLEAARRLMDNLDLPGSVRRYDRRVAMDLTGAVEADVERVQRALVAADFRLLPACSEPWPSEYVELPAGVRRDRIGETTVLEADTRPVLERAVDELTQTRPPPGEVVLAYEILPDRAVAHCLLDAPIASGTDIVSAKVGPDGETPQLAVQFSDSAGSRLYEYTADHQGSVLAVMIDRAVVMAPVIRAAIPGGSVVIALGTAHKAGDAERLAQQLTAAASGLRVVESNVVHAIHPTALGRPALIALGILGGVAWLLLLLVRGARWPWLAASATATGTAIAECYVLLRGGTLSSAVHLGAIAVGLGIAAAVATGGLRGSRLPAGRRLLAAWPSVIPIAAVFVLGLLTASAHGFWRGVSVTIINGSEVAVPVAVLAIMALRRLPSSKASRPISK